MYRIFILSLFLFCMFTGKAQKSVDDYKYIVVPDSYDFLGENDLYQLNSLTKFLFNKYGFIAFMQKEKFPEDLSNYGCKALRADLKKESSLFQTKLIVELKDCKGKIIFTSAQGKSREKEYKPAYHEALRSAFVSIELLKYKYKGDVGSSAEYIVKDDNESNIPKKNEKKAVQVSEESNVITFHLDDAFIVFETRDYGYEIFKKESDLLSIGKAFKSSDKKSYLLQANDLSGHGFFDGYGNFVLERVNPVTTKLITDILARQ